MSALPLAELKALAAEHGYDVVTSPYLPDGTAGYIATPPHIPGLPDHMQTRPTVIVRADLTQDGPR